MFPQISPWSPEEAFKARGGGKRRIDSFFKPSKGNTVQKATVGTQPTPSAALHINQRLQKDAQPAEQLNDCSALTAAADVASRGNEAVTAAEMRRSLLSVDSLNKEAPKQHPGESSEVQLRQPTAVQIEASDIQSRSLKRPEAEASNERSPDQAAKRECRSQTSIPSDSQNDFQEQPDIPGKAYCQYLLLI